LLSVTIVNTYLKKVCTCDRRLIVLDIRLLPPAPCASIHVLLVPTLLLACVAISLSARRRLCNTPLIVSTSLAGKPPWWVPLQVLV